MRAVPKIGLALLALGPLVVGCGDDGGGGGGEFATLRGQVVSGPATRTFNGFAVVNTSKVDAIWAIPARGKPQEALAAKIVVELASDGAFAFTPEQQGVDYILALVNSAACVNTKARNAWTEADIDARTACILGYVSIPDEGNLGSMVLIPTSSMTGETDVGEVKPSSTESDEATSTKTLQDVAASFTIGLGGLQELAQMDNTLKALIWSYANRSDDGSEYYELAPNYSFFAPNTLEGASTGETNAADFLPGSWGLTWGTTVDSAALQSNYQTPGYLEFVAPHAVSDYNRSRYYRAEEPMGADFISGQLSGSNFRGSSMVLLGAADGIWKVLRSGDVVAKFDMRSSSPFNTVDGVLNTSKITNYVPTLELETGAEGTISAVKLRVKTWDGSTYASADAEQALNRVDVLGITLAGNGGAGCSGDESESVWESTSADALSWSPSQSWVVGPGSSSTCGLASVSVNYNIFGAEYFFAWSATKEPFEVLPRSSSYLGFDPDNDVIGSYVSFAVISQNSPEWRDADIWVELSDIATTPSGGLVKLGASEDGAFHMRRQTTSDVFFYLEFAGGGTPPASYQTSATLTVHDGRPGRSQRSVSYPVSWSNSSVPVEDGNFAVVSYVDFPLASVPHGEQLEFAVHGSMDGLAQGDHFSFSPASLVNWPADDYELVSSRVLLLKKDTLELATAPCFDAACNLSAGNPANGLGFYAAESNDFDYQILYTFRWAGASAGPTLSSMVWKLGSTFIHALASDNAAAPTLKNSTATSQMTMAVVPAAVSLADGPLRVEYSATISHATSNGFFGDTIRIDLPPGSTVVPRTSRWQMSGTNLEEGLGEPTVTGTSYEWAFGTSVNVGSEATLLFDVLLAQTAGAQVATGQAWVGNTAVDMTVAFGDDAPASATVTVNP